MSPLGNDYIGRQMPRRNDEFHQIHAVPKYTFDVNAANEMMLT